MNTLVKIVFGFVLVGVIAVGSLAFAAAEPEFACATIWDPVICADGEIYSNFCFADLYNAPLPCYPVNVEEPVKGKKPQPPSPGVD